MEAILEELDRRDDAAGGITLNHHDMDSGEPLQSALQALALALRNVQPLLAAATAATSEKTANVSDNSNIRESSSTSSPEFSVDWLHSLLERVSSELGTDYLMQQVWEIATQHQSALDSDMAAAQQQDALFNVLGFSEAALATIEQLLPHMSEIATHITATQLRQYTQPPPSNQNEVVDVGAERRTYLVQEAQQASELATLAQVEAQAALGGGASGAASRTHTIGLASTKEFQKQAEKAQKRAQQAWQRAKEAGALVPEEYQDGSDPSSAFGNLDTRPLGPGGLMTSSALDLEALQQSLLPEGSRQYYDQRGLPRGTIHETYDDHETVIIPPQERDESKLHPRLVLSNLLTADERRVFTGTTSLNPMQSTVFEKAFHSRDNLMVCAPTGAG